MHFSSTALSSQESLKKTPQINKVIGLLMKYIVIINVQYIAIPGMIGCLFGKLFFYTLNYNGFLNKFIFKHFYYFIVDFLFNEKLKIEIKVQ